MLGVTLYVLLHTTIPWAAHATFVWDKTGQMSQNDFRRRCRQASAAKLMECSDVFENGVFGKIGNGTNVDKLIGTQFAGFQLGEDFMNEFRGGVLHTHPEMPVAAKALTVTAFTTRTLLQQKTYQYHAPYNIAYLSSSFRDACQDCIADDTFAYKQSGRNVTVYSVGTGVHMEAEDLQGHVSYGTGPLEQESRCSRWHGTHLAGIIGGRYHGVAKDARIVSVSVGTGCMSDFSILELMRGLQWIADTHDTGPAVVLIAPYVKRRRVDKAALNILDGIVSKLLQMNITVVTAAGSNRSDACNFSPAHRPDVITVGAIELVSDESDASANARVPAYPHEDTNYGQCMTIWAVGSLVESTFSEHRTAVYSGTAQAAATVAGLAAVYLSDTPNATPKQVREHLLRDSRTQELVYSLPESPWAIAQLN